MIDRRSATAAMLGALALPGTSTGAQAGRAGVARGNILRVPFVASETGFDPPRVSDRYSRLVTAHIFEAPYCYDYLASPTKVRPLTAAAMPEVSDDFRVWTIRIAPGTFFADDAAFKGRQRELVAEDYSFTLKRFYDPALRSPGFAALSDEGIVGLDLLRNAALQGRKPFDYDSAVEGLRVLDRYTLQISLSTPRPRFIAKLCDSSQVGAVAREVVKTYGEEIVAHPVGTGAYRLKQWNRSSRIVLERNPGFREMLYDAEPAPGDVQGQAWLARFKGRRLPLNDGVEIAVLEESQPRWLTFLNGQIDYLSVPPDLVTMAAPNGKLAPNLVKHGISSRRYVNADFTMSFFNMDDPDVGGYTPGKVALRRAVGLAYDIDREIKVWRGGQAIPAQAAMTPGSFGYDPGYCSPNSEHDPARAKALLDVYGYLDRDGDGFREHPDGRPLTLRMSSENTLSDRQSNEIWQKSMEAIGLRIRFINAQWPENLKSARAGSLQMWRLADSATDPDAQPSLEYMYGPSSGDVNLARFRLPAFDAIYRRMKVMADTPERAALFIEASNLVSAYMPYRIHAHRIYTDLSQPWITGWRQPAFGHHQWQYVEVDPEQRSGKSG